MKRTVIVIGGGFAGLSAATTLAAHGWKVTLLDKNEEFGGRARTWRKDGFLFDLGPSFYWMPDVFERYFARFGARVNELYDLRRLDPSYAVVFGADDCMELPAGQLALQRYFDRVEPGAGRMLERFLDDARIKYDLGINDLVYKPSLTWSEYLNGDVLAGMFRSTVFTSLRRHVQRHFKDARIRQVMEFPVLFLGAAPQRTPALYSLMNHADMALGTWYPMGGIGSVVEAMVRTARAQGVELRGSCPVERIIVENGTARGVVLNGRRILADAVVAAADYHHVESDLLGAGDRGYSQRYWDRQVMAPSALMFYLGLDRRLPNLQHHTLFFDEPLDQHSADIYDKPRWPRAPLFYASCTSKTDPSTAPPGCENLTVLIPIAAGLDDAPATREHYYEVVMERLGRRIGFDPRPHVVVKRSYCIRELVEDHHAFKGNAYGLANTLRQTGPWRPRIKSRKVKRLYFAGQLTVPGPGVPPALISGQVAADLLHHEHTHRA